MIRLAVDAVVFTIIRHKLRLLLIKRGKPPFEGKYALPGGFVEENEDIDSAAARELNEETGVENIFLKQIGAYGAVNRDPRGRIVTIAYLAIIDSGKIKLSASDDAEAAGWFSANELPELAFDHKKIIESALEELRFELQTTNIAYQLMPKKFTLTELQKAYETILGESLDKRNFRKRTKQLNTLQPLNETKIEGVHRPAQLFSFRERKYRQLKD